LNLSTKTLIAAVVTWTGIVAAATWTLSLQFNDNLRETIKSYEKAEKWKLPEAITASEKATKKLMEHLNKFENLDNLRTENIKLKDRRETLQEESTELKKQVTKLNEDVLSLQKMYSQREQATVKQGASASFFNEKLVIGAKTIYDDWVTCYINGNYKDLSPGQFYYVSIGPIQYRVVVKEINYKEKIAHFDILQMK